MASAMRKGRLTTNSDLRASWPWNGQNVDGGPECSSRSVLRLLHIFIVSLGCVIALEQGLILAQVILLVGPHHLDLIDALAKDSLILLLRFLRGLWCQVFLYSQAQ